MIAPVAVVTGAASGIGSACVERLAADGFSVVSVDVAEPADGRHARHLTLDLLDVTSAATAIHVACPRIDALVNCAGIPDRSRFADARPPEWERVVGVNLRSPFFLSCLSL